MIVMDRENAMAAGWSHVHSDAPTLAAQAAELDAFRRRVGAPPSAFQPNGSWLHLDIKQGPRRRALACPDVRVFDSSRDLVLFLREQVIRNTPANRAIEAGSTPDATAPRGGEMSECGCPIRRFKHYRQGRVMVACLTCRAEWDGETGHYQGPVPYPDYPIRLPGGATWTPTRRAANHGAAYLRAYPSAVPLAPRVSVAFRPSMTPTLRNERWTRR